MEFLNISFRDCPITKENRVRRTRFFWAVASAIVVAAISLNPVEAGPFQKKSGSQNKPRLLKRIFKPRPAPTAPQSRPGPQASKETVTRKKSTSFSRKKSVLSPVAKINSKQPRIFILGDSQGFTDFGPTLQRELVEDGYEVLYHAVKNGTPYYWSGLWKSPVLTRIFPPASHRDQIGQSSTLSMIPHTIEEYANAFSPDVFVIQGGTNFEVDLARDNPEQISKLIRGCLEKVDAAGARVLWIGPPDARDDVKTPEFQELAIKTLESALEPWSESQQRDCFFESRQVCPISNQTGGDGEHPTNRVARDWAMASSKWVDESVEYFLARGLLKCQRSDSDKEKEPFESYPILKNEGEEGIPRRTMKMDLRLSGKSNFEKVETLPYTDAFSVFRYELMNPDEIYGVQRCLTSDPENPKRYWVYVLHWTVHNPGTGPRKTRVGEMKIGERRVLELAELNDHPLGAAVRTMPQCNQFDDFLAPLFVSKDLASERNLGPSPELKSASAD